MSKNNELSHKFWSDLRTDIEFINSNYWKYVNKSNQQRILKGIEDDLNLIFNEIYTKLSNVLYPLLENEATKKIIFDYLEGEYK